MSESVEKQVCQIAADVFNVPVNRISRESSPQSLENWDSGQHLNFILALEQWLNVQLEPEDIEQVKDVGTAIDLANRKLNR